MAVVLALSALALLVVTLLLFLKARKDAPQGTPLPNGRALVLMTLLGLMLALASQLPMFR